MQTAFFGNDHHHQRRKKKRISTENKKNIFFSSYRIKFKYFENLKTTKEEKNKMLNEKYRMEKIHVQLISTFPSFVSRFVDDSNSLSISFSFVTFDSFLFY